MSWKQRFVIALLVLGNLVLYGLFLIALRTLAPQQAAGSPPTAAKLAQVETTPPWTPPPALTPTPTSTPTETWTPTATLVPPTPSATPSPTVTPPPTATSTRTRVPTRIRPRATPVPAPSPTPSGPLLPSDTWRTLGPKSSVWYKIGEGGYHINAILQAQPLDGMTMEVFAPNLTDRPIGLGSLQRGVDGLVWAGGRWEKWGDWTARITNDNASAVQYRLVVSTSEIPACETIGYWEYIGTNLVYWQRCK